tara:strand:- start:404 stop:649 length:246 start_codon:yes stop_codon:yes gene_type:complete
MTPEIEKMFAESKPMSELDTDALVDAMNAMNPYEDEHVCRLCDGINSVKVIDTLDCVTLEAETTCSNCGHRNYWAHGLFYD